MSESIVAAIAALAATDPETPAIIEKRFGKWVERSRSLLVERAARLANGFESVGIGAGDTVATIVPARLEWVVVDVAAQAVGARVLALSSRLTPADIGRLLAASGAATVVVAGQDEADVVLNASDAGELPALARIVYIDAAGVSDYASELLHSIEDLEADGAGLADRAAGLDPAAVAVVAPEADGSLVEISHATLAESARSTIAAFSLGPRDRVVAVRDAADPVERGATIYAALLSGALLAIPESRATTDSAIHEIAPTYVHVTERWLANKAARITVRFDENRGIKSWLAASWQRRTGSTLERYGSGLAPQGIWRFTLSLPVLEDLGLEKARAVVISGDPAPRELLGFYTALGLPVKSALGLARLGGFATIGDPGDVDGWVGLPAPTVSVEVVDGRLVVTTPAAGRVETGLGAQSEDGGVVVNGDSPEDAAETRLRSIPVFSTAIVSPGAESVVIELDGAIASRWAAKNQLDAATYRSFSQLVEMQEGVQAAVAATLKQFDLTPGAVTIASEPLDDIHGALWFGDVPRRDAISG